MNKKKHIIDVPDVPKIGIYAIRNKKNNKYMILRRSREMDKDIKIIMTTNKTKREAEEYLKRGTVVYEYADYLEHFDEYAGELEEEYK